MAADGITVQAAIGHCSVGCHMVHLPQGQTHCHRVLQCGLSYGTVVHLSTIGATGYCGTGCYRALQCGLPYGTVVHLSTTGADPLPQGTVVQAATGHCSVGCHMVLWYIYLRGGPAATGYCGTGCYRVPWYKALQCGLSYGTVVHLPQGRTHCHRVLWYRLL